MLPLPRPAAQILFGYLPPGFYSRPGGLSFTVTSPGQPALVSDPFALPASAPTVLALCPSPDPATVTAKHLHHQHHSERRERDRSGAGHHWHPACRVDDDQTVRAHRRFRREPALHHLGGSGAGNLSGRAQHGSGQQIDTEILPLTISAGTVPAFFFAAPVSREVGVPFGGSGSIQFSTIVNGTNRSVFDISSAVTGLPPKTTASFSPAVFSPGQSVTVTITAASDALLAQNVTVTLVGTPSAQVATASSNFLVDVTAPPGSLADSRTDFVSLAGTPYAAVYDQAHDLIFASNPD